MQTVGNGQLLHGSYRPIGEWNATQVTSMIFMCSQVRGFNGNLSKWTVDQFICMLNMFSGSKSFNQDLSKATWNKSST